jgi:hypothetical protein
MDLSTFWSVLVNSSTPWLPSQALLPWALHGAWALVLGAVIVTLSARQPAVWRWSLTLASMAWLMLPGEISPAHWLGLAFQMPSLSSVVLCLMLLAKPALNANSKPSSAWQMLSLTGVVWGWVLLLDTLALTPVSIYAWGFSPAALGIALLLLLLFWALWGGSATERSMPLMLAAVLALYVCTRLPSGNLWDTLLDPWLWLILQWHWLRTWVRKVSSAQ